VTLIHIQSKKLQISLHLPNSLGKWSRIFEESNRLTLLSYKEFFVNKTELIEHIAKHADISKAAATRALESTIGAVKTTLKKGGSVSLVGFGTFAVGKRASRVGRNPRTGAAIKIKAAKVPKFRPGKALKDALN
jgi:DNA-binding protein HU-beta